jgi:hypothetical protein
MRITSMHVANFLSYKEVEFDFTKAGLVLVEGKNGCLSGDTLIDMPRDLVKHPQGVPIKDLVGTTPMVYAWRDGKIVIEQATRVWKTKRAKTIKVTLRKSGRKGEYTPPMELVGTTDHLVMLSDTVTWKKLGELSAGDRLCSMYRRESGGWRTLIWWTGSGWMKMGSERRSRTFSEQQFVCAAINGPRPKNHDAHHLNDNPYDHSPDNLKWKPHLEHLSEHTRERNLLGLAGWQVSGKHPRGMAGKHHTPAVCKRIAASVKGSNNPNASLRWSEVLRMRKMYRRGVTQTALASIFGVAQAHVSRVVRGKAWKLKRDAVLRASEREKFYKTPEGQLLLEECTHRQREKKRTKVNHEVIAVVDAGVQDVYDMTVPGANSFIANGVVVHNSGKSAVCEALIWCLFGSTLRGYANDEVIHRKVGEDCLVQVFMEDDDTRYVVQRARRHSKFKNSLRVTSEDVDISGPGVAETQVVVERLLGCSMRTFLSSVVFGQDRAYRFSSLTDKEQKEILDEMLGVERFASACSVARERASLVQAALDVAERDHEKAEEARDAWDATAEDLRKKDRGYEKSRAEKVEEEREKLKKAREWVKENDKVDTGVTKTKVVRMAEAIAAADKHAAEMADGNTKAQVMLASARSKVEELRKHVKRHEGLGGDCPTCGQKVLAKQQESILEDLQVRLVDANKAMAKVEAAAKEIEQGVVDARKSVKSLREKAVEVQKAHAEATGAEANLASWRRRVEDHERRISELKEEANPFAALVANAEKRVSKHTKEVELLAKLVEEETARKKLADFWVTAFGARGLRSLLLDGSLPLLNAEASKLSRAITGGTISIEFSATSELKSGKTIDRFDVRVDNKHGAGSYQGNSAGERAKVDLCVGLALQRLVASRSPASFNIAVFDEAFDALDQSSHERVMEVMSEIDKEAVLIISHNEDLQAWVPAVWSVSKKNGFSKVTT